MTGGVSEASQGARKWPPREEQGHLTNISRKEDPLRDPGMR